MLLLLFGHPVVSNSLRPHVLQCARPPCPSPSPKVCPSSCPLHQKCHPAISPWCPLLLLPSIFPSIRDFSSESAVRIRWPKCWSFSFSISSSNKYSQLISLKIDKFDLLAVQGTLMSLLQHHSLKALFPQHSAFFVFIHTNNGWIPNRSFSSILGGHSQRILLQKAPTYRNPHTSWIVFG